MYTIGIDIGSVSTKGVVFDGRDWEAMVLPTGWTPREMGKKLLTELCQVSDIPEEKIGRVVGTGYGRIHLPFADKVVSEIACHARGCSYLFPGATGVIDVGGQDSKAMVMDGTGRVIDFVLNDKCAAGTGRFLQVTAQALGVDLTEVDEMAKDTAPLDIGSMCAVFAETEVINLLMQGKDKPAIVAGILKSIARKIVSMAGKVSLGERVVFTGGLAYSKVLTQMLVGHTGWDIYRAENPQITGALGAAVIGYDLIKKGGE